MGKAVGCTSSCWQAARMVESLSEAPSAAARTTPMAMIAERIRACRACALGYQRTNAVPGEGNPSARVLFVGEAPGFNEDQQGRPFVGQAGKLLDDLLGQAGLRRDEVFIANTLKCRPPGNRDPLPGEMDACSMHLEAQIAAIAPEVIVTLGRFSLQRLLPGMTISRVHGQKFERDNLTIVPMYHPAAALHQGSLRAVIEADFRRLSAYLRAPEPQPQLAPGVELAAVAAEQGRLF